MDYITIDGVPPYDGRYEWDIENRELTTREWGWIKRLTGYLPLNIEEGLGDPELVVVFAAMALRRAGKVEAKDVPQAFERLSDAPFGERITLETDVADEEDDAGPPASSSTSNGADSGASSIANSVTSVLAPSPSGTPGSATSESGPPTLVT